MVERYNGYGGKFIFVTCCRNGKLCVLCLYSTEKNLYVYKAFKGLLCFFMQKLHKEEENYGRTKTGPGLIFKNI